MTDVMFELERHRHGVPTPEPTAKDIVRITYVQGIDGRDDMQFLVRGPHDVARKLFMPGDYAVLRDMLGRTLSWGKVLTRATTVARAPSGELTAQPHQVAVAGWWDFLSRAQVHVTVGGAAAPIGTVFSMPTWQQFTAELTNTYASSLGAQLSFVFRFLARLEVPQSLGGGVFGDLIPVVYDEETAERFAPAFKGIEAVDSGYLLKSGLEAAQNTRTTTVGGFLAGSFLPEPSIIELFPAMVDGGTEPYNSLASALGRRPVLIYRVKPWREEPLWRNAVSKATYVPEDFEISTTVSAASDEFNRIKKARLDSKAVTQDLLVNQQIFAKVTLDTGNIEQVTPIPEAYIHTMRSTVDDASRLNAATIALTPEGGVEVDTLETAGLPILIDDQIKKHGLRMHNVNWPMLTSSGGTLTTVGSADVRYYRTVAAQVMQFNMMNHVLETGMMDLHYTAALRIQESKEDQQTKVSPVLDIHHGRWFRTKIGDLPEYLGYITALQHSIVRDPSGTLSAKTTLQYIRGHYADAGSLVHTNLVPIGEPSIEVSDLTRVPEFIGRTVSNLAPVVIPNAPPQARAIIAPNYAKPATTTGNYLLFRGNELTVNFPVQHMPIDLTGATVAPYYKQGFSSAVPRACVIHANAGSVTTSPDPLWKEFNKRVNGEGRGPYVAHIIITPSGAICQVFDLAQRVLHAAGGNNLINNTSVAVEFIVPGRPATDAAFAQQVAAGPWPSAEEWRWYKTDKVDGTGPHTAGPLWPRQYGPTNAQKAAFKRLAGAFLPHLGLHFTAIPRPPGVRNAAVRARNNATALAMYNNPAWSYFHHAQLEVTNRTDAAGLDILEVLGVAQP